MANKTIGGLDSAVTIADGDLVAVYQGTTTRKTTVASLRKEVENPVIGFDDLTGAPDDNAALKAQFDALEAQIAAIPPASPFKVLAMGVGNPNAPTSGSLVVSIPFPAGYNSSTSFLLVSMSYMASGAPTSGRAIRKADLITTVGTTGWTVNARAENEENAVSIIRFQYVIFATGGVVPGVVSAAPSGVDPSPIPADPPILPEPPQP